MITYGATSADWDHFTLLLGPDDLLPVVSNPQAVISPLSKMQAVGKTPSTYNRDGNVIGFPKWTSHYATLTDIDTWAAQPDYGICIQTRHVRAIDVDVTDPALADAIARVVADHCGALPLRHRSNSAKFLVAFILPGEHVKCVIRTAAGVIEFLANGQQFVAIGTHPAGMPYQWAGGLPATIPALDLNQFQTLWAALSRFAIEPAKPPRDPGAAPDAARDDPVAQHLIDSGAVLSTERDGRLHITCPFESEHTGPSALSATTYWPAHTGGYTNGNFRCLHAHCEDRKTPDFLQALGLADGTDFQHLIQHLIQQPIPTADPRAIPFRHISAIVAERREPRWLIDDVLEAGVLATLSGARGTFKSFIGLDWVMRTALSGHGAAILSGEGAGLDRRIDAWMRTHAPDKDIADMPVAAFERPLALDLTAEVTKVVNGLAALPYKVRLLLVDTYSKYANIEENDNSEVAAYLTRLSVMLRDALDMSVLLVCHTGHSDQGRPRGAYALMANPDAEYIVTRPRENSDDDDDEPDDLDEANLAMVSRSRFKDTASMPPLGYLAEEVDLGRVDARGRPVTSLALRLTDQRPAKRRRERKLQEGQQKVMDVWHMVQGVDQRGVQRDELIAAMRKKHPDIRRNNVPRMVDQMVNGGYIVLAMSPVEASGSL